MNIIYALSDPRSGEIRYVGKSTEGMNRPREHFQPWYLQQKKTHCANWIRHLLSLGVSPAIEVVEEPPLDQLDEAEIFYIAYFRFLGFRLTNHTEGGEGVVGLKHSAETRAKMSASRKGRPNPNSGSSRKGKPLAPEHRVKISIANQGKKRTKEECVANSVSKGGRPFLDGNGKLWNTTREAARVLGLDPASVWRVLNGKMRSTGGHRFTYVISEPSRKSSAS